MLAPSKNVTVPVAAPGETVAVRVTLAPKIEGLRLEASVTVVAAGAMTNVLVALPL